ncbi:MAG: sugar transferase [Acetivibrionales bacterium]
MSKTDFCYLIKRLIDITLSLLLIAITLPLFIAIAALIKLDSKGPVFFVQERGGLKGVPFGIIKFRTMRTGAVNMDHGFEISKDDPRITRIGRYLRSWSLDELPQVFNVLKGEMSIVGPRPALMQQIREYSIEDRKRLLMKPGITGLAQINGRNLLTWEQKIDFDIKYVENWSLLLDFKILLKTVPVVIKGEGIYEPKQPMPPRFGGDRR